MNASSGRLVFVALGGVMLMTVLVFSFLLLTMQMTPMPPG